MIRHFFGAAMLADVFHFVPRAGHAISGRLRRAERPEAFVEFDPRKSAESELRNAMPGHTLGAGGRAELFRLPRS